MIRYSLYIALINVLLGFDLPLRRIMPASGVLFPMLNNLLKHPALSPDRRRLSEGLSSQCGIDIYSDSIWCIDAQISCDVLGDDHTKWVIQIDHDTEYMCYPSSCSADDLEQLFIWEMEHFNVSAKYCTLDCPPIEFDVTGTSEDGQIMTISGMYNYADLSYDCAGAAAMTEISRCEETGACPGDSDGLTTCTLSYEDRLSYAWLDLTWKGIGQLCLPNECTNEANLLKMEDFYYAWLINLEKERNGLSFTAEEIRVGYFVDYSCPTNDAEERTDNSSEEQGQTSSQKYSNYVLIFGIISALLFVLCVLAICALRIYRGGGVVMTPIIAVELNNRHTFAQLGSVMSHAPPCDRVETGIVEDSPRTSSLDKISPFQTNQTLARGERD